MPGYAQFGATIEEFLETSPSFIVGELALGLSFDTTSEQARAWNRQVEILHKALLGFSGHIYFEFTVPRIGARIDVVLVMRGIIFAVEFKVGAAQYLATDVAQAWDYALDLKNFHRGSREAAVVPVLVATEALKTGFQVSEPAPDGVFRPICTNADELAPAMRALLETVPERELDGEAWAAQPYSPSPTIIEAARALYASHSVAAIAQHGASAKNLGETTARIDLLVSQARARREKLIIFVTGVPGAGKTLVGLDAANKRRDTGSLTHAVFLSGNGPLVEVLKEALVRDEIQRLQSSGVRATKKAVAQKVKSFIQNVHHFRDAGIRDVGIPPADHIVIFDEAQRAWNESMMQDFLKRKRRITNVPGSEPRLLLSYVDRHEDWAVVICLVVAAKRSIVARLGLRLGSRPCAIRSQTGRSRFRKSCMMQNTLRKKPSTHWSRAGC